MGSKCDGCSKICDCSNELNLEGNQVEEELARIRTKRVDFYNNINNINPIPGGNL